MRAKFWLKYLSSSPKVNFGRRLVVDQLTALWIDISTREKNYNAIAEN
jgi:hypothetical protein